jgi:hypothetical protein
MTRVGKEKHGIKGRAMPEIVAKIHIFAKERGSTRRKKPDRPSF